MTLIILVLALIVVHEGGHAAAAALLGYRPRPVVRPHYVGIRMHGAPTPAEDVFVSLAGPCMSVMVAVPLLAAGQHEAAWLSVAFALENLVPFRVFGVASDGRRVRDAVRALRS